MNNLSLAGTVGPLRTGRFRGRVTTVPDSNPHEEPPTFATTVRIEGDLKERIDSLMEYYGRTKFVDVVSEALTMWARRKERERADEEAAKKGRSEH